MKFGAVFIQKQLDEGLSKIETAYLYDMLKGKYAIPVEIQTEYAVAMGFVNLTDAELMDYDFRQLESYIKEIISNEDRDTEICQYKLYFNNEPLSSLYDVGIIDVYIGYGSMF